MGKDVTVRADVDEYVDVSVDVNSVLAELSKEELQSYFEKRFVQVVESPSIDRSIILNLRVDERIDVEVDTDDVLCDLTREELQSYFEERFSEEFFIDHSKTMEVLVDEYFKGVSGFNYAELFKKTILNDPSKSSLVKELLECNKDG